MNLIELLQKQGYQAFEKMADDLQQGQPPQQVNQSTYTQQMVPPQQAVPPQQVNQPANQAVPLSLQDITEIFVQGTNLLIQYVTAIAQQPQQVSQPVQSATPPVPTPVAPQQAVAPQQGVKTANTQSLQERLETLGQLMNKRH